MSCRVVSCRVVSCCVVLCCDVLYRVVLCCVELDWIGMCSCVQLVFVNHCLVLTTGNRVHAIDGYIQKLTARSVYHQHNYELQQETTIEDGLVSTKCFMSQTLPVNFM